ncbi:MAG TPA: acyl-CoA dehydrogenase [Sphingobium sp.]|uniref:acyl-CoA dehydrogenase n=1 Tax=Sphingobium sp. TaxID=1912891 RepID=UPI002ED023E4
MNFDLSDDQEALREAFARFLDQESSMARVRAALPGGYDSKLWAGLAELGAFSVRVPEEKGGLGLGLFDATVLMEEVGRTLASGPVAEVIVAARLLAHIDHPEAEALLGPVMRGEKICVIAFDDLAARTTHVLAGGATAHAVLGLFGDDLALFTLNPEAVAAQANLGQAPLAAIELSGISPTVLARGAEARAAFGRAVEEWKLLTAAGLAGTGREAIRLAAAYAAERKQFGQPIGAYQAISHPLADLISDVDGGKLLVWKALVSIAAGAREAAAEVSLAMWWNADAAVRAGQQALQTFGGYGLTTEYDIHLYNLRARATPLVFGDMERLLEEAGERLYGQAPVALPDVGTLEIDFDLGADARAFAEEVDAFFEATLTPELRAKAHYSWDGHHPGVHKKLSEARLLFPSWPKELGGRNIGAYSSIAARAVWETHGWTTHASGTTQMIGTMIRHFGSDELKRDVLNQIAQGEILCSLGYSEPASGSDVFAAQCRAVQEPDGSWRIDGAKMFTSGANLSSYVLLLARTDPDAPKHKGLTMFIVPLKAGGVEIQPVYTFMGERTNITYYDEVRIPDSYRLGDVNGGARVMSAALGMEQGGDFSKSMIHNLHCAEELCRTLSRNGSPLIEDRVARARLARAYANAEISQLLGYRAAWGGVTGKGHVAFGPMAKMFSSEKFLADASDLVSLTAPASLLESSDAAAYVNLSYRHAHGTRIYGGTSQVHRSIIAERYLDLPRSRAAN